jgi:hypothetical protein
MTLEEAKAVAGRPPDHEGAVPSLSDDTFRARWTEGDGDLVVDYDGAGVVMHVLFIPAEYQPGFLDRLKQLLGL